MDKALNKALDESRFEPRDDDDSIESVPAPHPPAAAPARPPDGPDATQFIDGPRGESWQVAARIVRDFRPVPRLVWVIIHNVYGRIGSNHHVDPMIFSDVEPLILRAATDKTLASSPPPAPAAAAAPHTPPAQRQKSVILSRANVASLEAAASAPAQPEEIEVKNLEHAVQIIGADVAASVCFIHAVCRRVANSVSEKVWRPILDDALLRAHMGYLVGRSSRGFGPGRGMMAGFCGRSGLAILIGSGSIDQAQAALSGLAAGVEIGQICTKVYGCNPLQVAAMAAVSAGFNRDIAVGVGSYNAEDTAVVSASEQDRWLSAFSIVENLRMNRRDDIDPNSWLVLAYTEAHKAELMKKIQNVQRRGHGWGWLTKPQLSAASEG